MKKDTSKSTVLVISMGFLALFLIFEFKWAGYLSLLVGCIGALSDTLSQKIEWFWMKLSLVLSYIVPTILLTIIFYCILFPIALLSKLFTKDPLLLSAKYDSYFVKVDKSMDKKSMENIW